MNMVPYNARSTNTERKLYIGPYYTFVCNVVQLHVGIAVLVNTVTMLQTDND